ncbi:MAG: type VI secretion system tube protein Hcp [Gaiellaceae bacterium]
MKKAALALLAVAAVGTTVAAIAWAATGDSAVIHACVAKGSDLVRIPGGDGCRPNESALDWNAQGPVGPQGPAGPSGAAAPEPNTRDVAFMHVDGGTLGTIDGEATDKGHEKWITVNGYDGDATVPVATSGSGGGTAAGKVQLKPIVVTKRIDKSTPKLFEALVTGRHLPAVQIDFVRPDGAGGDDVFYSVKLKQVLVTDAHQFDLGKSDGQALEQVSLDFQSIEITEGGGTTTGGGGPAS